MLADLHVHAQIEGQNLHAKMRLALHELQQWVALPRDDKGHIVISDLAQLQPKLRDYLDQRLRLSVGDPAQRCEFFLDDFLVDDLSSVKLSLRYHCPVQVTIITLESGLFVGSDHAYEMRWELRKGADTFHLDLDRRHNKASIDLAQVSTTKTTSLIIIVSALGLLLFFVALALWVFWRKEKN